MNSFTASELRARIQKQVEPYPTGSYGEYLSRTNLPDCRDTWNQFLSDSIHQSERERQLVTDWITKSCRFDKDGPGCDDIKEDRYSLRDEGRNPDGSGESYAERNL